VGDCLWQCLEVQFGAFTWSVKKPVLATGRLSEQRLFISDLLLLDKTLTYGAIQNTNVASSGLEGKALTSVRYQTGLCLGLHAKILASPS